jgi:hypothetical protein
MVKKELLGKAFDAKGQAGGPPPAPPATAEEGVRLIRAFIAVRNPRVRQAIVNLVENLA